MEAYCHYRAGYLNLKLFLVLKELNFSKLAQNLHHTHLRQHYFHFGNSHKKNRVILNDNKKLIVLLFILPFFLLISISIPLLQYIQHNFWLRIYMEIVCNLYHNKSVVIRQLIIFLISFIA